MSNSDLGKYLETFPAWLGSLGTDAEQLGAFLQEKDVPIAPRQAIAGGLNYLFKSLDLIPDGIDDREPDDVLQALEPAHDERPARPRAGEGDVQVVAPRLGRERRGTVGAHPFPEDALLADEPPGRFRLDGEPVGGGAHAIRLPSRAHGPSPFPDASGQLTLKAACMPDM